MTRSPNLSSSPRLTSAVRVLLRGPYGSSSWYWMADASGMPRNGTHYMQAHPTQSQTQAPYQQRCAAWGCLPSLIFVRLGGESSGPLTCHQLTMVCLDHKTMYRHTPSTVLCDQGPCQVAQLKNFGLQAPIIPQHKGGPAKAHIMRVRPLCRVTKQPQTLPAGCSPALGATSSWARCPVP